MPDTNSGGIVSEEELKTLCEYFKRFEGAGEPLSEDCKASKLFFLAIARNIYFERVRDKFGDVDFTIFLRLVRRECRTRVSKESPPFQCP